MLVVFDNQTIRDRSAGAQGHAISWADITRVSVEVTAVGSNDTELTWVIAGRHGRNEVCIPMGAPGEAELVCAMQRRLPDFDNMAVVEALSSAEVATFVVWEAPAKH